MHVGLIGISYKSSDLEVRELFIKASSKLLEEEFKVSSGVFLVLLSTCNRTEIYFTSEDLAEGHSAILAELKKEEGDLFEHKLYSYFGETCFDHLAKVTTGFESVIFGEAEIQRQVKDAYQKACLTQSLPSSIHYLFQKSLKIGKEIRTIHSLPKGSVSIESTVADLIRYFFGTDKSLSVLFVGYSEINRKVVSFLQTKGFLEISLATRNGDVAREMAQRQSIKLIPWFEIGAWPEYDVVITGTHSSQFLLRPDQIPSFGLTPSIQTRLVVDLSLPRNVDPSIEKHPAITLFNIEEMNSFMDQKQRGSSKEKEKIRKKIEESVSSSFSLYQSKKKKIFVCA